MKQWKKPCLQIINEEQLNKIVVNAACSDLICVGIVR